MAACYNQSTATNLKTRQGIPAVSLPGLAGFKFPQLLGHAGRTERETNLNTNKVGPLLPYKSTLGLAGNFTLPHMPQTRVCRLSFYCVLHGGTLPTSVLLRSPGFLC